METLSTTSRVKKYKKKGLKIAKKQEKTMKYITAFFMAWGNFCAIPCPCKLWDNNLRKLQLVFFPVIGLMMGVLWWAVAFGLVFVPAVTSYASFPIVIVAAVVAAFPYLITGFIHLDGFMDCSDAILSRRDLVERQRILKDSHVGAFSVISVVMLMMFSFAGAHALMTNNMAHSGALITIPVVSRICSAFGVLNFAPIGHSQYKESHDKGISKGYSVALVLMFVVTLLATGALFTYGALIAVLATAVAHFLVMLYGRKQLGGMSGDIAGYALTVAECVGIIVAASLWS